MRISKLQLAGLAAALASAGGQASANDVTVSTATTTPLATSAPDGASPGNVNVVSGGSITVSAGQTAVTVDSNNNVSNAGSLNSTNADNTTGILLQGGFAGPQTITNSGTISLLEDYTRTDTDSDGDPDGAFATGLNRNGIRLQAGAAFNGDILNSGSISIEGQNSAAIRLDAQLNGDLTSTGSIAATGENGVGVGILGGAANGVTGDVIIRGGASAIGGGARGLLVDAPIGGELRINGTWLTNGYSFTTRPLDVSKLDADDLAQSGPAIDVHYSVAGGITIEGVGVEDDLDDDGDGILDDGTDTNDDAAANITVFGAGPAVRVLADPSANVVLGPTASGYGLHVRGAVTAAGVYDGVNATAIWLQGSPTSSVSTASGVAIDGDVAAVATEAISRGVYIGENVDVPTLLVRRRIASTSTSDGAHNAYGVFIDANANVPAFSNSGTITTAVRGETADAIAIFDGANTLASITNSGSIIASVTATDTDVTDDIPPPPVTGAGVAIDVSGSSIGVTLNQIPDVPFTDDDTVDNDVSTRPAVSIQGDILFGSGADTVNLLAGTILGDVSFGLGANAFNIDGGASYAGRVSNDGTLAINVGDGTLTLSGGVLDATSATFGADSVLRMQLSSTLGDSALLQVSGNVSFAAGASVVPVVPAGLPASGSHTIVTAGSLTGGANVENVFTGAGTPFLYNLSVSAVGNSLVADFVRKTPVELNLTANQTALFAPLIDQLAGNDAAAAALASIDNEADFQRAYQNLTPSYSSASIELAMTGIQQAQGATSARLASTRMHGLDEVSVWAQEIGYSVTRTPPTSNGQEYSGNGFGLAVGIDGPLRNGPLFGLSASMLASEATEDQRPDGELSSVFGQGNAYLATALGPIDLDFILGAGAGRMKSRRFVEVGPDFTARTDAEWWAYEGHASLRASAPMTLGKSLVVTPQAAFTYVSVTEEGYTETGGGAGIDIDADEVTSQRLWGDAGLEISLRRHFGQSGFIAPRIFAGYRANLIDDPAERDFAFVSGGAGFTLVDDPVGDGAPLVGIGLDATNGYTNLSLSYEGEFGDQIDRHSLNVAVRFKF